MGIDLSERDRLIWKRAFDGQADKMPLDEFNQKYIPWLIENRHLLPPEHEVHELLDRWDPETQTLRPE